MFKARSSARQSQQDLHENNIRQFEEQIGGLEAEIKSKSSQLDLIATELTGVQELYADEQRRRLKGVTLVSGMPVEVFLKTNSRTMLSYLFKPITDQFGRMFNEP